MGLSLIANGSGGIKPCVSGQNNVGDQFPGKSNEHLDLTGLQLVLFLDQFRLCSSRSCSSRGCSRTTARGWHSQSRASLWRSQLSSSGWAGGNLSIFRPGAENSSRRPSAARAFPLSAGLRSSMCSRCRFGLALGPERRRNGFSRPTRWTCISQESLGFRPRYRR